MRKIKHTCSLGVLCHASQLLKRNNIKYESYPFDWIFSNENMIIDCLNDNFEKFLNRDYYISVINNDTNQINFDKCGHSVYHPMLFNHHNPKNIIDYNYFIRCVVRFNKMIKNDELKLFVMFHPNINDTNTFNKNDIEKFNEQFMKHSKKYVILVIMHSLSTSRDYRFEIKDNIHYLELRTISRSNGVAFIDEEDNKYLDKIIMRKYSFNKQ
jgi:hypothetical protein